MSYSILVETSRECFDNLPQKFGAFHPAAPKIVSWLGCTVRSVRRVGQEQIARSIDRFEKVAQNKFDITLAIERCIEPGELYGRANGRKASRARNTDRGAAVVVCSTWRRRASRKVSGGKLEGQRQRQMTSVLAALYGAKAVGLL